MKQYSVEQLKKIKHLSDYSYSQIFTGLGLYEDVLIDTYSVRVFEFENGKSISSK